MCQLVKSEISEMELHANIWGVSSNAMYLHVTELAELDCTVYVSTGEVRDI